MKTLIFISIFFLCSSINALHPDDFDWKVKEEKNGIKIFTAARHEETGIVPIKAQTILDHPMPKILSVLATTERKIEWIPKLLKAYVVETKSKYERIEYALYDSPWPFNDRAFVISTKGRYNPKENNIFIDIHSVEHIKVPHDKDHVRGNTYIGSIYMKGLTATTTYFEVTLLTDFKGAIPTWIINLVQGKWPYKMFSNLKEQLAKNDIQIWPEFTKYDP